MDNQSHNKKNKIDGKQNFAKSNIHEKTGGIFENMLLKIFNPPEYERRLMIRRAAANDIHSRQHNILSETLEDIPQTIWYGATEWHYEMRDKLNKYDTSIYTHKIILDEQMEWRRETRDIFHQDGIEPKERKYCHPNGWEVVYDGKSLADQNPRVVTDDKIRGTYNYIDPGAPPENWYDVPRWTEYAARGIGHTVVDIVPYWILGNSRK